MQNEALHEEVRLLLPWFLNKTLAEGESSLVESHLDDCEMCRQEYSQLKRVQTLVATEDADGPDYRFSFGKLMDRIDDSEREQRSADEQRMVPKKLDMRWPIFGIAAGLVLGVFVFSQNYLVTNDDVYRTLNVTQPAAVGTAHRLYLTFNQPIKAQTMRSALIETQSYLVSGPDEDGRYLVEVEVPEAMSKLEFVTTLRAIDGVENVVFAQSDTGSR